MDSEDDYEHSANRLLEASLSGSKQDNPAYINQPRLQAHGGGSAASFVVQPILISSAPVPASVTRAPPSLIPISTFSNQQRTSHSHSTGQIPTGGQHVQHATFVTPLQFTGSGRYEAADDVDDDDDEEEEERGYGNEQFDPLIHRSEVGFFNSSGQRLKLLTSTSPLVSSSSHSVISGVKLHIRRAAVKGTPSNSEAMDVAYSEEEDESEGESESSSSSSKNTSINSILSAIRSNTSLTIEEVPIKPSTSSGSVGFRKSDYVNAGFGGDGSVDGDEVARSNDTVDVFVVPQQKASDSRILPADASIQSQLEVPQTSAKVINIVSKEVKAKRGRPRRQPLISVSPPPSVPREDNSSESVNRRTSRSRKPTKHFMPDISRFRGYKKWFNDVEFNKNGTPDSPNPPIMAEDKFVNQVSSEAQGLPTPKKRGRQSTGRSRGRPRGSTLKAKLERESAAAVEAVKISIDGTATPTSKASSDPTSEIAVVDESVKPRKNSRVTTATRARGTRVGRGGARGGKRITKAQKIQTAKLKKLLSKRKDSLQLFEEETRMSAADVKIGTGTGFLQTVEGEDASNSTSTSATSKLKKLFKIDIEERRPVTSETLFEYHWPADDPLAEIFFLQEQVSEYLGVKSFKRKYPDLKRRTVEMPERDHLRGHKVVSETQCDLGLTALYSSEVLEIMFNDFPEKYEEYRVVVQERRDRDFVKQKSQQTPAPAVRDKGAEFMRRILNSISTWNSKLNKERNEQRSCSFDLQSFTLNIQKSKMKVLPPYATKTSYYPVSLLPGQYTDNYKRYSASELKYLPLNTVCFGPLIENQVGTPGSDESSDSDASSSSDDSSSSSDSDDKEESTSDRDLTTPAQEKNSENAFDGSSKVTSIIGENEILGGGEPVICKTCEGDVNKNKDGHFEVMIQCTKCSIANHPSCLELSLDMLPFIKKYNWQCTDCKNCIECNDPADEDKMLFCDLCDRGYHIYCVGLRKVPTGRWHCRICSVCYSCGAKKPANDDRGAEWHHEVSESSENRVAPKHQGDDAAILQELARFKKGEKGLKFYMHSVCMTCHKLYKKGQFCPFCLKSHHKIEEKTHIECRTCEKWVHKDCVKRPLDTMLGFMCDPCDASFRSKAKIPVNL